MVGAGARGAGLGHHSRRRLRGSGQSQPLRLPPHRMIWLRESDMCTRDKLFCSGQQVWGDMTGQVKRVKNSCSVQRPPGTTHPPAPAQASPSYCCCSTHKNHFAPPTNDHPPPPHPQSSPAVPTRPMLPAIASPTSSTPLHCRRAVAAYRPQSPRAATRGAMRQKEKKAWQAVRMKGNCSEGTGVDG